MTRRYVRLESRSRRRRSQTKLMCNVCDRRGVEAEADHVKEPRCVTRKSHARFTDLIVHFRMDWRGVCRGIDDSCWTVCGGIDGSRWTVCAGIGGSRGGVLCTINCFGAPLIGARGFLGFRPLLFGMELELPHSQALHSSLSRYCCTLDDLARASIPAHRGRHAPGRTRLAHLHVRCRQPPRKMGGSERVSKAVAVARRASYVAAKRVSGVRLGGNWLGLEL
jgi:hypothetical protein